jgi:adenylyl-sulfate kinase
MTTISAKVFWLFGRSGAGKTTLARRLQEAFQVRKLPVLCLDGDDFRSGLCSDLGFSSKDRLENHRRVAEMARLTADQGFNVVVSTMAPEQAQRDLIKQILGDRLVLVYIHASLEVCIRRDPKGLYGRAKSGTVQNLLHFPFDPPQAEDGQNRIDTETQDIETCQQILLDLIFRPGHKPSAPSV